MVSQLKLWEEEKGYPPGFKFYPEVISLEEERELLSHISTLHWEEVRFHGVVARRRVAHFGHGYEFGKRTLTSAPPIPDFLRQQAKKVAAFLQVQEVNISEILVTHYPEGAPIDWHRDAPAFESLFGISIKGSAVLKLRKIGEEKTSVQKVPLPPRSGYSIMGEARWRWQHHIPPQKEERFSITFRTLRENSLIPDTDL